MTPFERLPASLDLVRRWSVRLLVVVPLFARPLAGCDASSNGGGQASAGAAPFIGTCHVDLDCQAPLRCVETPNCGFQCRCTQDSDCPTGTACVTSTDCGRQCGAPLPGTGGASGQGGVSGGAGGAGAGGLAGATASACTLSPDGLCATSTSTACCPMKGEHFYWDATATCKKQVATASGTVLCVATTYPAESGCGFSDVQTCLSEPSTSGLEVILAGTYWKPSDAGPGWSKCDATLYQAVMTAKNCP